MQYMVEDLIEDREYVAAAGDACWREVDQMKGDLQYDLDWEIYTELNDKGQLRYYTVRTDEGRKVGFALFIISPSLHNKGHFVAGSDCMYIEKDYRGCGQELLSLAIDDLKLEGVSWFSFNVKSWLDKSGNLGKDLGCTLYENVYQRSLL
jgi:GNAT superfamily N-acetyltransferase